jgi:hypothetical protein
VRSLFLRAVAERVGRWRNRVARRGSRELLLTEINRIFQRELLPTGNLSMNRERILQEAAGVADIPSTSAPISQPSPAPTPEPEFDAHGCCTSCGEIYCHSSSSCISSASSCASFGHFNAADGSCSFTYVSNGRDMFTYDLGPYIRVETPRYYEGMNTKKVEITRSFISFRTSRDVK